MSQLLYFQEGALEPILQVAGWVPGLVWAGVEKRTSLAHTGSSQSQISVLTILSWPPTEFLVPFGMSKLLKDTPLLKSVSQTTGFW